MMALSWKTDMKRLLREPILLLMLLAPILATVAFRLMLDIGGPILLQYTGFSVAPYRGYVFAFAILLAPAMLGTVAAFMMIDERDEHIYALMAVTPIGDVGYVINRMLVPFVLSILYSFLAGFIIGGVETPVLLWCFLTVLSGLDSLIVGLALFGLASDKVKGLTLAKGLSAFMVLSLADLLQMRWFSLLASCFPFYWTGHLLNEPVTPAKLAIALLVHLAWLLAIGRMVLKKNVAA
jgi:fluoroquinolone transport system permease protein